MTHVRPLRGQTLGGERYFMSGSEEFHRARNAPMGHPALSHRIWEHLQAEYVPGKRTFRAQTNEYTFFCSFGPRRLSDECRDGVLSVEAVHLASHLQNKGIMTHLIVLIREDGTPPRIPLRFLHFQECNTDFGRLLKRLHFHRYQIAQATDWWLPITGQKELPL